VLSAGINVDCPVKNDHMSLRNRIDPREKIMAFYVVTYDLVKKNESEYQELWDELDSLDSVKTQDSVYLVASSDTQREMFDRLRAHVQENDRLMVVTFSKRPSYKKALKGTNDWIEKHFAT
jgi:hypothetical protein